MCNQSGQCCVVGVRVVCVYLPCICGEGNLRCGARRRGQHIVANAFQCALRPNRAQASALQADGTARLALQVEAPLRSIVSDAFAFKRARQRAV